MLDRLHRLFELAIAKVGVTALIFAMVLLSTVVVLMSGNVGQNLQGIVLVFLRLNALLLWCLVSGKLLDLANGVNFAEDRKLIEDGNLAVAVSRGAGFAALVIAGAMLIAKV